MTQRAHFSQEPLILLAATGLVLAWSGVQPFERGTWWLEVAPVLIGMPVLIFTLYDLKGEPWADGEELKELYPKLARNFAPA